MMKVLSVAAARPNFMKVAPLMREMAKYPDEFEQVLVHTGQHYDDNMSQLFFDELDMPRPDINLEVGSGSHAEQTAGVMRKFEPVVLDHKPDWVIVVGDVNSTLACALVCAKLGIKTAHVEAGLRSFDRTMPEELNRLLTDQIADLLFTPSKDGDKNLAREGIPPERIHFVGDIMMDTLEHLLPRAQERWPALKERFGIEQFALVTLHRPRNVDNPENLAEIVAALEEISADIPVIFPVHPRTKAVLESTGPAKNQKSKIKNLKFSPPLGYLDFLALESHASLLLTDSGGIQGETTYLGVPCLTIRPNTERPITITHGTNHLVGNTRKEIVNSAREKLAEGKAEKMAPLPLWDGRTAERIVSVLRTCG